MTSQPYKTADQASYATYGNAALQQQPQQPATVIPAPAGGKSASAFRTISEVADQLGVQQHVLRFWESKFSQVRPLKRGGGRRYYRPEDVELLKSIHHLLYTQGYTIRGVQKLFREQGKNQIRNVRPAEQEEETRQAPAAAVTPPANSPAIEQGFSGKQREILKTMLKELKELRGMINDAE